MSTPTLAVWKFASCDGCQLTLLDCQDELLTLADQVRIATFAEASSTMIGGPYDVSLVEGSITTAADERRIHEIREQSGVLVTIGACATAGGVQALRNLADIEEFTSVVYARPEYIDTLATSTPIAAHVEVDYQLQGCPIDRGQLLDTLAALLVGRKPRLPAKTVCTECKTVVHEVLAELLRRSQAQRRLLRPGRHPQHRGAAAGAAPGRHVRRRRRPGVLDLQRHHLRRGTGRHVTPEIRTLTVGALTRVEGEGALRITLRDGQVHRAELNIYEPPRFFEAFLRGRPVPHLEWEPRLTDAPANAR